jgi:two-component system phosphate regulon sensor histidine kinase PhoR
MTPGLALTIAAVAVIVFLARQHIAGLLRLRRGLRRVARGELAMPIMLDLPRGLRSAERDLKTIAARVRDLECEVGRERLGLSAVLGSISEGVFLVDRDLRVRLANRSLEDAFSPGAPPIGRTVMEVFRSIDVFRLVEEGMVARRPHRGEIALERAGTPCTFEFSISPVMLDDGTPGAVVVVHDITRIKKLESVRREFVANVSHELRTPLTIISGYLETLLDGGLGDRVLTENALQVMFKHADRLRHLIDDLLTISQAESGTVPLEVEDIDLRDLLHRVIVQLDEPIRARQARVQLAAPAGDDPRLQADAVRLEQVFVNLLENALKYGHRPGLEVELRIGRTGAGLTVEVSDNGPGIPYEDQEHIFERFYRVHKHRSRDTGGTGLGLSIVKNIVQAHGGTVSVESVPGQGSKFLVVLPARQNPPAAAPAPLLLTA